MAAYCDKPVIIPHIPHYSSYERFRYSAILSALMPKSTKQLYLCFINMRIRRIKNERVDAYLVAISAFIPSLFSV